MRKLDCIIIGVNDVSLDGIAMRAKVSRERSGDYAEIRRNSYLINGRRVSFCGLLNHDAERVLGFDPRLNAFELPNLGAYYLANYLEARGLAVEVINLFNVGQDHLDQLLADEPVAVAVTTTYYVSPEPVQQIVAHVRERSPRTRIIVGGPYIARSDMCYTPAERDLLFRVLGGDIFVVDAQGEATLAQVVQALRDDRGELGTIPNLVYREPRGGRMTHTPRQPENKPLQDNSIDWSRFPIDSFTPVTFMRTSRSCPFSCAFCDYPRLGGPHQVMPVEPILREMRQLSQFGTRYLLFTDDTFNVPLGRFKDLLRAMIAEQFNFQWISFFRCSHVDDECFELMRRSGCLAVYLGIESGDEAVLRAMNKYATAAQYRRGLRLLHENGILSFASFITGYPGETPQSVRNTVDFIEETHPTFFNTQLFFLDPTAPIGLHRDEFGIAGAHYKWHHKTMGWDEASAWADFTLRSVTQSVQLPLYGFGIWSLPYLLAKGFTLEQVKILAATAQARMLKALGDEEGDYNTERGRIDQVLHTWDARRLGGGSLEGHHA